MKLPPDVFIAREKLTGYLLAPQSRGDKSAWLARAGYTLSTADDLERDLRAAALTAEAQLVRTDNFGQVFQIIAELRGPNGRTLRARTFWMREHLSGRVKFITLTPVRESRG
jgi:hypothetical protein